uniref:Reverse transcriptase RNase H-like domain-containing protein n=1 Tax=Strigamia maritima TaxID=126957 RepID=T1ILY1_STRMM
MPEDKEPKGAWYANVIGQPIELDAPSVCSAKVSVETSEWFIDACASHHVCGERKMFNTFKKLKLMSLEHGEGSSTITGIASFRTFERFVVCRQVLLMPDLAKPFVILTDASHQGLGAVLCQDVDVWDDKKQTMVPSPKPVAFASRVLRGAEVRYSIPELECLAVVWAIERFKPFLEYTTFILESDAQALKWLMSTPEPSGRFGRWAIRIQSGAFKIVYRQGRLNCVPDALSRAPLPDEKMPIDDYVESKEVTKC